MNSVGVAIKSPTLRIEKEQDHERNQAILNYEEKKAKLSHLSSKKNMDGMMTKLNSLTGID